MALIRALEDGEAAILNIVQDPILFSEFLRNTNNGSMEKDTWPKRKFKLRWYQRDLMTDRSEFIVLTAGRAVGKCMPASSLVYTEDGYRTISQMQASGQRGIVVWCLDDTGKFVKSRARIAYNKVEYVFTMRTRNGYDIRCSKHHPILTPTGYKPFHQLKVGDEVVTAAKLPEIGKEPVLSWYDLRWLGYMMHARHFTSTNPVDLKYQKQVAEMHMIAKYFDGNLVQNYKGEYQMLRQPGFSPHYGTTLMLTVRNVNERNRANNKPAVFIHPMIKKENNENLKVFLESFLSLACEVTEHSIHIKVRSKAIAVDIRELLLRYGITVESAEDGGLLIQDSDMFSLFFSTFSLPGISVTLPDVTYPTESWTTTDVITEISEPTYDETYAVQVAKYQNYISDGIIVHNSLVLEDRLLFDAVNPEQQFPDATREHLLVTPNMAQMSLILDRVVARSMNSPIIRDFLEGRVNRTKGVLDYERGIVPFKLLARIAGTAGTQTNMIGLHQPKITGDEMQAFPMNSFIELMPTYNAWEKGRQQFFCGVPNGLREGNVLYMLDQRSPHFKKYRVPAHNNPFYTMANNLKDIRDHQGENTDNYLHLVLGKHGNASFAVVPRDNIILEPYDFYSYQYNEGNMKDGQPYYSVLNTPKIDPDLARVRILAMDMGYTEPTLIQLMGRDADGVWRTLVRWRLTRIPFPLQTEIIDWIQKYYQADLIGLDVGAGGGGIGVMQNLISDPYRYNPRLLFPVRFNDPVITGYDAEGTEVKEQTKAYAGQYIARIVADKDLRFSEMDVEGVSQVERISYQRRSDNMQRFFVLSDKGAGETDEDHVFASYVVFIMSMLSLSIIPQKKVKLFNSRWI